MPASHTHAIGRKTVFQLVCVALSVAALIWLLGRIGWPTIAGALGRMSLGWLAGLMLLGWSESLADGAALWVIMGDKLRLGFAIAVNAAGSMLNLLLPWESGEVLKGTLLRDKSGTQQAVSGTILWNYIFKLSRPALSATAAVFAWLLCRNVDGFHFAIILVANALAFVPYVILRVLIRFGAAEGLLRLLRLIPVLRRHPTHWVNLARNIDSELKQFWRDRPADYVKVFFLQVVGRMTGWVQIYFGFRALGLPCSFGQTALIYATMNVAEYVIAVLPARVGVGEGTAFLVFKFLNLDPTVALVMYLTFRVRTIVANGLLTPFAFIAWKPTAETQNVRKPVE